MDKRLRLRELREDDLKDRVHMCNDKDIQMLMSGQTFDQEVTLEDMKTWFKLRQQERASVQYAIVYEDIYIGDVDLNSINQEDQSAYIIPMIGKKAYWNRGLGTQALERVKEIARDDLALNTIYLEVLPFNHRAIRTYEKIGFVSVGESEDGQSIMKVSL